MTNQEAFDTMVRHARRQGKRSETLDKDHCLYRGPEGLMCFVGAIIPDDEYKPEWDEKGIQAKDLPCAALAGVDKDLLNFMQYTHDFVPIEHWEERFERYAKEFHLTLPPLEAAHA